MFKLFRRDTARTAPPEQTAAAAPRTAATDRLRRLTADRPPAPANGLKTAVLESLTVLEATLTAIDQLHAVLAELKATAAAALGAAGSAPALDVLSTRYGDLRDSLAATVERAAFQGVNLLNGTRPPVEIAVGGLGQGTIAIRPVNLTPEERGLALPLPDEAFASPDAVAETARRIDAAEGRLRRATQVFIADAAMLATLYQSLPGRA